MSIHTPIARDFPALEGTSRLSAYLKFGMVSAADAVRAAYRALDDAVTEDARASAETWLNELIWREFYSDIQYHFPHVHEGASASSTMVYGGRTMNPTLTPGVMDRPATRFVDAGMRQLATTGWMHNRLRMVTASFLVKHLLVDWRWGERWFMQHLIDGDPASNNGGWQWVAGTGTDAAPYFRIFNPVTQSQRFDLKARSFDGGFPNCGMFRANVFMHHGLCL